jgi:hypothetical protein
MTGAATSLRSGYTLTEAYRLMRGTSRGRDFASGEDLARAGSQLVSPPLRRDADGAANRSVYSR